jgi:glycosyltransferase involved in cell wall biosynthesis
MPVYNAEKYLQEAIDSILQQTLTNFEFLIIDDGSTDSSVEIIRSYTDPRIRLVQNEKNLGMTLTLNKGIELSSTEIIARMDADDISYPERLQIQFDYFKDHPDCALLSTWAREVTVDKEPYWIGEFESDYYNYCMNFENWIYHPTVMYKRSAVIDAGMYCDFYSEDYDLWWRISRKFKTFNISQVLLDYRLSDESLCRVVKKNEYHKAHHQQVIRNIHHFTGNTFSITYNEVEFLRNNFEPILNEKNFWAIVKCLNKLKYINRCILQDSNVGGSKNKIKDALNFKWIYIIKSLYRYLPKTKLALILIFVGNGSLLLNKVFGKRQ